MVACCPLLRLLVEIWFSLRFQANGRVCNRAEIFVGRSGGRSGDCGCGFGSIYVGCPAYSVEKITIVRTGTCLINAYWTCRAYRVHSQVRRAVMPGTEVSLATALLRLLKGPCHLPRRKRDPTTCPLPSLQWIQSARWRHTVNRPSRQLS
jgi:hypothetical protein